MKLNEESDKPSTKGMVTDSEILRPLVPAAKSIIERHGDASGADSYREICLSLLVDTCNGIIDGFRTPERQTHFSFRMRDPDFFPHAIHQIDPEHPGEDVNALIWQGHMLDLLGRREEAKELYQKVVRHEAASGEFTMDQYGLKYVPSRYALERLETPFKRIENVRDD